MQVVSFWLLLAFVQLWQNALANVPPWAVSRNTKKVTLPSNILARGDSRSPTAIFEDGLQAKPKLTLGFGEGYDLNKHVQGSASNIRGSNFVSTTSSLNVAELFATYGTAITEDIKDLQLPKRDGWVYLLSPDPSIIDVEGSRDQPDGMQKEFGAINGVERDRIIGAYRADDTRQMVQMNPFYNRAYMSQHAGTAHPTFATEFYNEEDLQKLAWTIKLEANLENHILRETEAQRPADNPADWKAKLESDIQGNNFLRDKAAKDPPAQQQKNKIKLADLVTEWTAKDVPKTANPAVSKFVTEFVEENWSRMLSTFEAIDDKQMGRKPKGNTKHSNCRRGETCSIKPKKDKPQSNRGNRPVGVANARVMDHFGGVAFNLALMASTCLTNARLANCFQTAKQSKPSSQEESPVSLWDRVLGLRFVPGLLWGSFTKLWSQENIDAFKKSWNDLKQAFSEVPDAVKRSVKDVINVENLDAFIQSCNNLSKAVKEIPAAAKSGAADLANLENADALGRSLTDFATAISEIPGAMESGYNDLKQAPGDIATAFQKAPRQLAEAAMAFTAEFDKYVSMPATTTMTIIKLKYTNWLCKSSFR
ncbi:hypothetical protein DCS_04224 [Drechmeria coniospora]|uniref:Heat-labile enterotoxin IIA, A chain n=1 Tax=Drechmeria coniospora TaxID=98403 RepID=A0A151GJE3_DRECN|nr:hypothetical protein DCS_04224 [Drechmeria coniospora]KYK57217.1 hypothetical protein DCS_04224 [Drechmeria coniospora]